MKQAILFFAFALCASNAAFGQNTTTAGTMEASYAQHALASANAPAFGTFVPDSISWMQIEWKEVAGDTTEYTEYITAINAAPVQTLEWGILQAGAMTTKNGAQLPFEVVQFADGGPLVLTLYPAPGAHVEFRLKENDFARPGETVYAGEWHGFGHTPALGDPFQGRKPMALTVSMRK